MDDMANRVNSDPYHPTLNEVLRLPDLNSAFGIIDGIYTQSSSYKMTKNFVFKQAEHYKESFIVILNLIH